MFLYICCIILNKFLKRTEDSTVQLKLELFTVWPGFNIYTCIACFKNLNAYLKLMGVRTGGGGGGLRGLENM